MSLIVFIGVTGAGKTTVGRELSRRHELPLYEVDEAVEEHLGAPMRTLVVGRDPRLATTAREEAERLLSIDEGIVTLGASQPLDPATASSINRRAQTAPSSSSSAPIFPRYHAEKDSVLRARSAWVHPAPYSPS